MDIAFFSKWETIVSLIAGIIFLFGVIRTLILFLPGKYQRWKEKYSNNLGNTFCCFVDHPQYEPLNGGKVHGGVILLITGSYETTHFSGDLFYGETELTSQDNLVNRGLSAFRVVMVMNYIKSRLHHSFFRRKFFGKIYLVPVGSKGFDTYEDIPNRLAEYDFEHSLFSQKMKVLLVKQRAGSNFKLPAYFKLLERDGQYFEPYYNVVNFVFRIHPQLNIP